MTLSTRVPTPEDLVSAKGSSRATHQQSRQDRLSHAFDFMDLENNAGGTQLPPLETWNPSLQNSIQDLSSGTKAINQNKVWGFDFDVEAMTKDPGPDIPSNKNTKRKDSPRVDDSDNWFGENASKSDDNQTDSRSETSTPPCHNNVLSGYGRTWRDGRVELNDASYGAEELRERDHDWSNETEFGTDNWSTRHQWFSGIGGSTEQCNRDEEYVEANNVQESEDVWDIGDSVQWAASSTDLPQGQVNGNDEEEEPFDELTRYWVTSNLKEVIRPRNKRLHSPFPDNPHVHQCDGDNWGSTPNPVMSYNSEGYTSDVLIEQSKREFWQNRDGNWRLLNHTTDTKVIHYHHDQEQGRAASSNRISSSDNGREFELEPYDFEGEGFVNENEWKKHRNEPNSPPGNGNVTPTEVELIQPPLEINPQEEMEVDEHPSNQQDSLSLDQENGVSSCNTGSLVELAPSSPTPLPPRDTLLEFASPHEWLNQIAKRTLEHFQESDANRRKEWTALMEKQEQDSKRLHDFIHQSNQAKTPKAKARTPISLTVVIETKDFGEQQMHVTGDDNLKDLVDDFCEKYKMESYGIAIWVTVARAIKKQKKKIRQQRAESLL
ncbi:hypothetical protein BGX27_001029 [Mortierella sp. AM989]|nr:hypothetical protein BGX27_001029 [Mortierella sp. AM989]